MERERRGDLEQIIVGVIESVARQKNDSVIILGVYLDALLWNHWVRLWERHRHQYVDMCIHNIYIVLYIRIYNIHIHIYMYLKYIHIYIFLP